MSRRRMIGMLFMVLVVVPGLHGDEAAREVKMGDLSLKVPPHWKQQPPSNNLRLGQFEIPAVEGDKAPAELTIFDFGAGGGVKANLDRWVEQFLPEGRTVKATQGKTEMGPYVLLDLSGTYKKPIGPPILNKTEPMPGARMLGIIISMEKKGNYFLKLTGPEKTVATTTAALRTAIGAKEQDEKPFDMAKEPAGSNK